MGRAFAIAAVIAVTLPAAAAAAEPRQSFSGTFTSMAPAASTGYRLELDYRDPANPQGKPHAVQRVLQTLNVGARIDTAAVKRCTASDAELVSQGASACPADSQVGQGELDADIGQDAGRVPRVIKTRVTVFNADHAVILFSESTNAGDPPLRVPSRSPAGERTFTSETPPIAAAPPPDPYLAIKRVRLMIGPAGTNARPLIRTPATCPAAGTWTNSAAFTYRDGITDTALSRSPCSGTARRRDHWKPRIRFRGVRRRCKLGRVGVRIGEHNRLRRAVASLDGRRVRSTRRKRFAVRVSAGRHRLAVVAVDAAGNRARRTVRFRRC